MQEPAHGAIQQSMLDEYRIMVIEFIFILMPDPPQCDIRVVLGFALVHVQPELLVTDEVVYGISMIGTGVEKDVGVG